MYNDDKCNESFAIELKIGKPIIIIIADINKGPVLSCLFLISNDSTLPDFINNSAEIKGSNIVNNKIIKYRLVEKL